MIDTIEQLLSSVRDSPLLPLWLLGIYVLAGWLFISVWLIIFQTGLLLAPPWSFIVAVVGANLSASTSFFIGKFVVGGLVRRKASQRVRDAVEGVSLEHIIALRILPVLPFTLINLSAGAFGVRFRTFFIGTVVGMAPGMLAVTLLGDRALAVFREPTPLSVAALVGAAALLVGTATLMRRWAKRKARKRVEPQQ